MKRTLSLFAGVVASFLATSAFTQSVSAQSCQTPPQTILAASYPQNSVVNFYTEPTFTTSQKDTIRLQLAIWSNQGLANVSFTEVFDVGDLGDPFVHGANPTLQFIRQVPTKSQHRARPQARRSMAAVPRVLSRLIPV